MGLLLVLATPGMRAEETAIAVEERGGHLRFTRSGVVLGEFWYDHETVLRPFFANLRAPDGTPVTRTFPPVEGVDATDHAEMHPGLWLGFGNLAGVDFWRNKGRIRHDRFVNPPTGENGRLRFATESTLLAPDGNELGKMENRFDLLADGDSLRVSWSTTVVPSIDGFFFGDQEEMGLGVRVATPLAEKNGGLLTNSAGATTAKATWGQPAAWCDYSGIVGGRRAGAMIVPFPDTPRPGWWHNRDYGVLVANSFGRKAMKQGEESRLEVAKGTPFGFGHTVIFYSIDPAGPPAWERFQHLAVSPGKD